MKPDNKVYHFVGIGGIGMSAVAIVMKKLGYQVSGSDINNSQMVDKLRAIGIPIFIGHDPVAVDGVDTVVISSAIKEDNIEVSQAKDRGIKILKRAEMLSSLMSGFNGIAVAGSHGKTTTTSLMAHVLETAGLDPTVVSGGIMNSIESNAKLGNGKYFVVEADESDGSFMLFPKQVGIVTNIDHEHIDHYKSFEILKTSFAKFVSEVSENGFAVVCGDDVNLMEIAAANNHEHVVTYGFCTSADLKITNFEIYDEYSTFSCNFLGKDFNEIRLNLIGQHNIKNASAVFATAIKLGIDEVDIRRAFLDFQGVKRRFTKVGGFCGALVIDDYAHHPSEIKAVINAARNITKGKVISVIQPHRYSRLFDLFKDFCEVAKLPDYTVYIPLYSAGEVEIPGTNSSALVSAVKGLGCANVEYADSIEALSALLRKIVSPGDVILMMGAGSITHWARDLTKCLTSLETESLNAIR